MKILNKISIFFKNIFHKNETKKIEEPKAVKKEDEFIKSIKVNVENKKTKKKVETMVCPGDGLGIQNKLKY